MTDLVPIRRALLSVSDKTDLIPFATALTNRGVEIISTGGTARAIREAGIPVTLVEDITGFPEIMDGRVKTLHPSVHGALLGRREKPDHVAAAEQHGIAPIDLLCVNLYPFEQTAAKPNVEREEAIEQIDIGGPAMLRAAAKNADWVTVVTSPRQYDLVISEMRRHEGATTLTTRRALAADAFARTASYDRAIALYLTSRSRAFPPVLSLDYALADVLRYGENPHQSAAVYRDPASMGPTVVNAEQLHGKQLSYNNYLDAAAALEVVKAFARSRANENEVGACVVKHTNPCGAAVANSVVDATTGAIAGDPMAAFGGILALNAPVNDEAARAITAPDRFFEVIIAPEFDHQALTILRDRWTNVRLLAVGWRPAARQRKLDYRSIPGGMLVEDRDVSLPKPQDWAHAAGPAPTEEQLRIAGVIDVAAKSLASNAVAIGGADLERPGVARLFGAGAGQMDRVASCKIAVEKAGPLAKGAVAVSDAFFPFPDGPEVLINGGVSLIVNPGGSKRDEETLALCEQRGVTCMMTGQRRFRH